MTATCKKDCTTSSTACDTTNDPTAVLYVAFELAAGQWKLAFTVGAGQQPRLRTMRARDLIALDHEIALAKKRFKLPGNAPVVSCYEAGRDGFWLHRFLQASGIENFVVDSASIEVSRRQRRAKNDRLDATKLVAMLVRFVVGERKVWSVVRVPSDSDEDARQMHRELEQLKDERTGHSNRIKGLLASQGLRARLEREFERMQFVQHQIEEIEKERRRRLHRDDEPHVAMIRKLLELRGIGVNGSWLMVREFFAWREIQNRREVAALAGLTPTPFGSGEMNHEQGISKAGNRRIRRMMVQLAWCWLRYQPMSELSQWYHRRFGMGNSRQRKIGIVALARKLLVALLKYTMHGEIPAGAELVPWHLKVRAPVMKLAPTG